MPLYEFECVICGPFSELLTIAERNSPVACPECHLQAARVVSAPFLAVMNPVGRNAAMRNERSQHEPRVGPKPSCCSTGTCSHKKAKKKEGEKPALQSSTRKNRRPWMLGH
jgi:putative FmdB family regulatory protein